MKTLLHLLLVACMSFTFSTSATSSPSAEEQVYMIHVGAFVKTKIADFEKIRPLGFLYVKQYDDKLMRVYMGDYMTEAAANKVLVGVKDRGYPDAYVTRRGLAEGKEVAVIQLGIAQVGEDINWRKYAQAGPIMVQANGKQLKVVVGTFPTVEYAKNRIGAIRSAGYSDAFVRPVNNGLLHRITTFEAGGLIKPSDGLSTKKTETPSAGTTGRNSDEIPIRAPKQDTPQPKDEPMPDSYDEFSIKSGQSKEIALPAIRKNVKRNSVIELQKILKSNKSYTGSLDGLYGPGTGQGYETALKSSKAIQKYLLLSKHSEELTAKGTSSIIQHYINTLLDDTPKAVRGLETSDSPTAKAYRAYVLFRSKGSQAEIDNLMNSAIKEAFNSKRTKNRPPFDYRSAYTYKDLNQLILHLRFIQTAFDNKTAFPCWLFQAHPKESVAAFSSGTRRDYRIEDCGSMMDWQELNLLQVVAEDLNPSDAADGASMAQYASKRAELLLLPTALSAGQQKEAEAWHQNLWKGLDAWEKADALHGKLLHPFKITYFQSLVRLEDFYMDKGMKPKAARGLSLCMLQTIVGPHMQTYLK